MHTCKASIDRALWLYSTTSTRDNTPDVKQKDSPPMGNPAKVTGSCRRRRRHLVQALATMSKTHRVMDATISLL
eukprot:1137260-Pelagomonas_calceolata.AAC.6